MTPTETVEFARWLQAHSALGRISLRELLTAFERAQTEGGYVVTKTQPEAGSNA